MPILHSSPITRLWLHQEPCWLILRVPEFSKDLWGLYHRGILWWKTTGLAYFSSSSGWLYFRGLDNHCLPEINASTVNFPNRLSLLDHRPRIVELFWLLCFLPCTIKNADRQYFSTISYKPILYHHYFNIFLRQSGRLAPVANNCDRFLWGNLYL